MKNGQTINFFYDGEGRPAYFTYNNATYYYVTNLQGDVIAILDSTGAMVVNYYYDAYGVLLQTGGTMAATLGTLNPLTYRGYVYDHETGLYYLQSRYYNPAIRQFISADAFVSTGQGILGYNMFAYCNNNPVVFKDSSGTACAIAGRDSLAGAGGAAVGGGSIFAAIVGWFISLFAPSRTPAAYDSEDNYSADSSGVSIPSAPTPPMPDDDDDDNLGEMQEIGKNSSLSKGSTGRTKPKNLKEKLAMEQVKANPLDGAHQLTTKMTDPRWPASEGWVKMASNINGVEIHFVYNTIIQIFDDFKFKE